VDSEPARARADLDAALQRGTNQAGMRAHNERLVLSLVRRHGALSKTEIARMTGLSAQTVSVIMRGLEADRLLRREAPQRGRVGQPSVPLSLDPEGAFFIGAKIGRRSRQHQRADSTQQPCPEGFRYHGVSSRFFRSVSFRSAPPERRRGLRNPIPRPLSINNSL
jgi:hypothetical protein